MQVLGINYVFLLILTSIIMIIWDMGMSVEKRDYYLGGLPTCLVIIIPVILGIPYILFYLFLREEYYPELVAGLGQVTLWAWRILSAIALFILLKRSFEQRKKAKATN